MPWEWRSNRRSSLSAPCTTASISLASAASSKGFSTTGRGVRVRKSLKSRGGQVPGSQDESREQVGPVLRQPIVQLITGAVRHSKIGDHHLVARPGMRAVQLAPAPPFRLPPHPRASHAAGGSGPRRSELLARHPPPAHERRPVAATVSGACDGWIGHVIADGSRGLGNGRGSRGYDLWLLRIILP